MRDEKTMEPGEDLLWMSGPAEAVRRDAFSAGPFPSTEVAQAYAGEGDVIVGKTVGGNPRIARAFHLDPDPVALDIGRLDDLLTEIARGGVRPGVLKGAVAPDSVPDFLSPMDRDEISDWEP